MVNFNIEEIFDILKKEFRILLISVLTCILVATLFSFFVIKPKYESSSKVFIGKEKFVNTSEVYTDDEVMMYQRTLKTYTEVVKTRDMLKNVIKSAGEAVSVNEALSNVEVIPLADTQILQFKYSSYNKDEVYNMTYALTEQFIYSAKLLYPKGNVQVIEQPSVPQFPISPNTYLNIVLGIFMGIVVGIGTIFLKEYMDNTIKSKEVLKDLTGIPAIGVIPKFNE